MIPQPFPVIISPLARLNSMSTLNAPSPGAPCTVRLESGLLERGTIVATTSETALVRFADRTESWWPLARVTR
jgi:hypothetical protein